MKKSILICGGTGFLGFHLAKKLKKLNWNVFSISTNKPLKERKIKNVKYFYCDISKKKKLNLILDKFQVDFVINFSGYVDHLNKKKTISSHYLGLKNLSNYYIQKKIFKFIQIGSSLEYGQNNPPHKENMIIKSNHLKSSYSLSKFLSSNHLINAGVKYDFPYVILRPYLIYGPYQEINRIIPIVIDNCLQDRSFPTSSGDQIRDFLYINDFIEIVYKLITNKNIKKKIFNIGSGIPTKVGDVVKMINKKIRKGKPIFGVIKLRKDESKMYYPNIQKLKSTIKHFKFTPLSLGLDKTIKYYEKKR